MWHWPAEAVGRRRREGKRGGRRRGKRRARRDNAAAVAPAYTPVGISAQAGDVHV